MMVSKTTALSLAFLLTSSFMVSSARCDESNTSQQALPNEIPLPTPLSHYERFKSGLSGVPLLLELTKDLDPETQKKMLAFVVASGLLGTEVTPDNNSPEINALLNLARASGITNETTLPKEQVLTLLKQFNWEPQRPLILEFMLHQSKVLDIIPPNYQHFLNPIVHDSLLYFLGHLPSDHLLEKLIDIAYLPQGSSRSEYLSAFVSKNPSLQKVGQILARNKALSTEYQAALQNFENGIHTMTQEELLQFITEEVGKTNIDKYQVKFADKILAEGSVGAVIRATGIPPGSTARHEAICKVIKPYALINLPQELEIIDGLAAYFTREHDFYQLGSMPLVEIFKDVRKALTNEVNIVDEQQNLLRARQYYKNNKDIVVPELYPCSTNHVTVMGYITGEKITSAFEGEPAQRAIMAKRLFDVMTSDVIFADSKEPIFHGDPHAGNVFHVTNNPKNPYQIALLDWGLYGTFPRKDRIALMQLILGVQLKDAKRLHDNVGALLEDGLPQSAEKLRKIDALIAEVLQPKEGRTSFGALEELLVGLINEGYATKFSLNLFIKSQITIAGILTELDPNLNQDKYLMQRVTSLVKHEIPKRLLFTLFFPAWNSHSYRSLLSNGDVLAARKLSKKPKTTNTTNAKSRASISKHEALASCP
jgi:ubiquinone biosynthesis protein